MKFQRKILLTYSVFILFIMGLMGSFLFRNNNIFLRNEIASTYQSLTDGMISQLDNQFDQMEFQILDLISKEDLKDVIVMINTVDHDSPYYQTAFQDAVGVFRSHLLVYSILQKYHSIIYLNTLGDFFSSNYREHLSLKIDPASLDEVGFLEESITRPSSSFIILPYTDPWSPAGDRIFGLGRVIRSLSVVPGFILAHKDISVLDPVFDPADQEYIDVIVLTERNEVFYGSKEFSFEEISYFSTITESSRRFRPNPVNGDREMHLCSVSGNTGLTVHLVVNQGLLRESNRSVFLTIFVGIVVLLVISTFFNIVSSSLLTKPLKEITSMMRETELEKSPEKKEYASRHDEIIDLNYAFHDLVDRLNDSVRREITINTAWMQARMDALQEQVNPHFLFNMLSVIGNRGYMLGDEEICETCDEIARMLRYASSTVKRSASIGEEVAHVQNYLQLMKRRLEDRISFQIDLDKDVEHVRMPRIVLQQLVENSLDHGYKSVQRDINIGIRCFRKGESWRVEVSDNGQGFTPEDLEKLEDSLEKQKKRLDESFESVGLEIGGMGLLNTYTRLYLYFEKSLYWEIINREGEGVCICFGSDRGLN